MLFNSIEFIFFFLPITLTVFFLIGSRRYFALAMSWLVLASLFYYGWWDPKYLILFIFSILFNFSMGTFLNKEKKTKPLLIFGITVNLGFLAYFKYTNFLIENVNLLIKDDFNTTHIILPLAISFFTFQQIAYLVDAYRNEVREYNFLHYTLFVTFFPQLIAGPIVHHKEMLPQFAEKKTYKFNISNLNIGLTVFVLGLFKKVALADKIAEYSTPVFGAADAGLSISFFEGWGGALAYTLQLYFDFSGYADMAIGIGIMFGIILPLNFNSPYKSQNIIDFWRRWHMTLSRFLKDYLYIPLGGNRKGSKNLNLFMTMLLGGLWHGSAWNFVIWGALHGFYLILNNLWRKFRSDILNHDLEKKSSVGIGLSVLITFFVVTLSWVFFRAETLAGALKMLKGMVALNSIALPNKFSSLFPGFLSDMIVFEKGVNIGSFPSISGFVWIIGLLLLIFFAPNSQEIAEKYQNLFQSKEGKSKGSQMSAYFIPIFFGLLFFISLKIMLSVSDSEFLYFNF